MAYACPVCGVPQADGEHLADHLALTAVLHGGDHEGWLDEHLPGWTGEAPGELGVVAVEHAEAVGQSAVTEGSAREREGGAPRTVDVEELDPETRRAIERAREMARERSAGGDVEE